MSAKEREVQVRATAEEKDIMVRGHREWGEETHLSVSPIMHHLSIPPRENIGVVVAE